MDKKRWIIFSIVSLFLIIISFYFDAVIVESVSFLRNDVLNDFFLGLTFMSSSVIIFFFLTSLFLWKEHKRKWILPLWSALGLSAIVSFVIKIIIQRPRPFQQGISTILPILEEASHSVWNFSFPSFHAMLAFCSVPILSKEFPKFKHVWIVFASLVALSRVYFGLHFMSDILIGGIIGYLLGIIVIQTEKEYKFGEKVYKLIFKRR